MVVFRNYILQCCFSSVRRVSNKACIVYITNTTNPYKNLAFESWMCENVNFNHHNCLFVWRSQPSVVIGRHQNPWKECNVYEVKRNGVNICRRSSGGGAVYHDLGNVNFTFFAHRKNYSRKHNLNIIVSALRKQWPLLDVEVNKRDDIILNQKYKISGSSSKLARYSSYHHCTLLIDADKEHVIKNLARTSNHMSCNATASVRSPVLNLADIDRTVTFKDVSNAVVSSYIENHLSGKIFQIATDDETLTPGIKLIARDLQDWKWIYGKTPDFSVEKAYDNDEYGLKFIRMVIKKGVITELKIDFDNHCYAEEVEMLSLCLCDVPFDHELVKSKLNYFQTSANTNYLCMQILNLL